MAENEQRFPSRAVLARNVLAVQVTYAVSESRLSLASGLLSERRNGLCDDIVTGSMCLRSWARLNG